MKCTLRRRVFARIVLHSAGVLFVTLFALKDAKAVDPDIPRTQAGAERGSIQQQIQLAAAYFSGKGVTRDEKQAAYWYEKAANSGDPAAQLQIGFFYEAGIGVPRDSARAVAWFERAVAGGSVAAKVNLGVAYMWGAGVRKDPELATQLFRDAAEKGSGPAACYLADSYYYGVGVPKDLDKAKHWLEIGAKRHDAQAELALAILLVRDPDRGAEDRAIKLLRDSAKTGLVAAKHELALRLIRRADPSAVPQEAFEKLTEASSQGYWKSTLVLGVLYRDGRGVTKDPEAAYVHFRIAIMQGGDPATAMLRNDVKSLTSKIGSSRLPALDEKAADWMSTHNRKLEYIRYPAGNKDLTFALAYPEDGLHAGRMIPINDSEDPVGETFQP
jgi:TPR repeat protein